MCRILDIPCKVCGDNSSGKHYNIFACDGCAGFFKRSIRRKRQYSCKGRGCCVVDKTHRNQCRACRLKKCEEVGMNRDAVQHERGPRHSTIRRFMESQNARNNFNPLPIPTPVVPQINGVLNLSLSSPPPLHHLSLDPHHLARFPAIPPHYMYNRITIPMLSGAPAPLSFAHPSIGSPPTTPPQASSPQDVCETAARIMFMLVHWARDFLPFIRLGITDQYLLLEENWKNLFVIFGTEFLPQNLESLLDINQELREDPELVEKLMCFKRTLTKLKEYSLDDYESTALKIMSLFNLDPTSERINSELVDRNHIRSFQNELSGYLISYETMVRHDDTRARQVLYMFDNHIKNVSIDLIEELFFKTTVGTIPMNKVVIDMYKKASRL